MNELFEERSKLSDVGNPYLYDEERDRDGEHPVREGLYPSGVTFLIPVRSDRWSLSTWLPVSLHHLRRRTQRPGV